MRHISKALYEGVRDDTFMESCGLGDLIVSCFNGRNRRVAMEWAKSWVDGTHKTFAELECSILNGQKIQGCLTSDELDEVIQDRGWQDQYPLFTTINRIINNKIDPTWISRYKDGASLPLPVNVTDPGPV